MHRFFVNPDQINSDIITIIGEDHHHLTKVLRIGDEELFEVCDGNGTDYHCQIISDNGQSLQCRVLRKQPSQGESSPSFTLYQGLPKGTKMDDIVKKNVELGIEQIIPFISERAVAELKGKSEKKRERWQKIAYAAAKQSKRGIIPQIGNPIALPDMISSFSEYDLIILCYEEERRLTLKQALQNTRQHPSKIAFIIGPEGGLTPKEAEMLTSAGAVSVSLGQRILRTETAGLAVLAQMNFFFEEDNPVDE